MKSSLKLIYLLIAMQACGQQFPLKEEELKLMPYKGSETLIFKSNHGEQDTIKLKNIRFGYHDGPEILRYNGQIATVYGDFSDPNPPGGKHRYLYGDLFSLHAATPERETILGIHLSAKNAHFYGPTLYTLTQFSNLEKVEMEINGFLLNDVHVINADTATKQGSYYNKTRENFINTIYWSRSTGLVRYVKKDGEVWTKEN